MVDSTLIVAGASLVLALASLVYARGQAVAARLQAQAAVSTAHLDMKRASTERRRDAVREVFRHPHFVSEYVTANGEVARVMESLGGLGAMLSLREFLVSMQVEYDLREAGITDAKEWAMAGAGALAIFRMPSFALYFENEVRRGIFEREFMAAHLPCLQGKPPLDPYGRGRARRLEQREERAAKPPPTA